MNTSQPLALLVALLTLPACGGDGSGGGVGGSGGSGARTGGGDAGTGGDPGTGGAGGSVTVCFGDGDAPPEADTFPCGGVGLTCSAGQACVRTSYPVDDAISHDACPEPAGCATPPDDACWLYECWDVPPGCDADCGCIEPHLQYDSHPAATCSDAGGRVWIDGAPTWGSPPWKDACFGACGEEETCWSCGPSGGCLPESEDPACQSRTTCSVEDPSGFPHPTCSELPYL
jgi:hypothetical protein